MLFLVKEGNYSKTEERKQKNANAFNFIAACLN